MGLNIAAIIGRVASVPMASGHFDLVQTVEPKSAPGNGLSCAIFVSRLSPAAFASGLAATSMRLELTCRLYQPFKKVPEDLIDTNMVVAADALFTAFSGDFELGGEARDIDLLGGQGQALRLETGFITIDREVFRTMDIFIPIIINDVYVQAG